MDNFVFIEKQEKQKMVQSLESIVFFLPLHNPTVSDFSGIGLFLINRAFWDIRFFESCKFDL